MRVWRFHVLSLLAYAALALLLYAPNLATLDTHLIGHHQSDAQRHARGLWFGMESIAEYGYVIDEVTLTNFPDGGRVFSLERGFQWMGMAFRPFLGVVAIYNILQILMTILGAYAAMLLAREFTGDDVAAWPAGAIFSFSATALVFPVVSGVAETAVHFLLPLTTLFALRSIYMKAPENAILAAVAFVLQALFCYTYGIALAIILVFLAGVLTFFHDRTRWRENRLIRGGRVDQHLLVRGALFVTIVALATFPLMDAASSASQAGVGVYTRPASVWPGFGQCFQVESGQVHLNLLSFVMPGEGWLVEEAWLDRLFRTGYIGLLALGLAGYGLFRGPRGSRSLGLLALLFLFLSLGPRIALGPGTDSWSVPNPVYALFWCVFPLFHMGRHGAARYVLIVQMVVAILAASGLSTLLGRRTWRPAWRWGLAAGIALLGLLETVAISPLPWPIPTTQATPESASLWLRNHGRPGAVLDVPVRHPGTDLLRGDILLQQIYHQRPVPYNVLTVSPSVAHNPFYLRLVHEFVTPEDLHAAPTCEDAWRLRQMGFAYIIFNSRFRPERAEDLARCLETCLGPARPFGETFLYSLEQVHRERTLPPEPVPEQLE